MLIDHVSGQHSTGRQIEKMLRERAYRRLAPDQSLNPLNHPSMRRIVCMRVDANAWQWPDFDRICKATFKCGIVSRRLLAGIGGDIPLAETNIDWNLNPSSILCRCADHKTARNRSLPKQMSGCARNRSRNHICAMVRASSPFGTSGKDGDWSCRIGARQAHRPVEQHIRNLTLRWLRSQRRVH